MIGKSSKLDLEQKAQKKNIIDVAITRRLMKAENPSKVKQENSNDIDNLAKALILYNVNFNKSRTVSMYVLSLQLIKQPLNQLR